jgi:hypothetical protein
LVPSEWASLPLFQIPFFPVLSVLGIIIFMIIFMVLTPPSLSPFPESVA